MSNQTQRYPGSRRVEGLEPAQWTETGDHANLAAAVMDGLEWLRAFQDGMHVGYLDGYHAQTLDEVIRSLERHSGAVRAEDWQEPEGGASS